MGVVACSSETMLMFLTRRSMPRCSTMTIFGRPVHPGVNPMYARLVAEGPLTCPFAIGSGLVPKGIGTKSTACGRAEMVTSLPTRTTVLPSTSEKMLSIRPTRMFKSNGRKARPALGIPTRVTIVSQEVRTNAPMIVSGRNSRSLNQPATSSDC